ncbi:MAG: class III extradiol ring-cleavage dioxygenase [Mariprofundus sp.]|nr:class III extradiol ring-cleavage dioxygenase [Mariprofundus sp.]
MTICSNASLAPVLYLPHGGGPLPLLGDPAHQEMISCLKHVVTLFEKPSAIVVISAHWEADRPTITSGLKPALIYDYYGFPKEAYEIDYPAAGDPELARNIFDLLKRAGIEAELNGTRGFDHGMFVPLKIMYPDADIPCVQISMLNTLDPLQHIQIGKALAALRAQNVLLIGSGLSFHNLKAFFSTSTDQGQGLNASFERWLMQTCSDREIDEAERTQTLSHWGDAPGARYCHPREEHLLPLHVCYGLAQAPAGEIFTMELMGKSISCYLWR